MNIALLQLNYVVGDIRGNAEKILAAVRSLASHHVDLCITSELALFGYPPRDLLFDKDLMALSETVTHELARALPEGCALLLGRPVCNSNKGNPFFNAVSFLFEGEIKKNIYKMLLPTYDVFDEARYFEPANDVISLEFKGKKLGISICEDMWNSILVWQTSHYHRDPIALLAAQGVDYFINVSASPFVLNKQKNQREPLIAAIAKQYHVPFVYVNQVGGNDELLFDGSSSVFSAAGEKIARAKAFQEDVLVVDLDAGLGRIEPHAGSEEEELFQALVMGTRDYVKKCRFQNVLLGLSGGIDSALVLAIAVHALGKEHVHGVMMPSPYSSEGSIKDALKLAENFGVKTSLIPIDAIMKSFDDSLAPVFKDLEKDVTEENIQARIRGNLLMAMSNKFHSLLLTTGNKSELAVGYCTIYGDMSGGLAVISDVPKTMVYRLCRWLNAHHASEMIPENIIIKAPSAELRPNQTDQDSLPDYDILDEILLRLIEEHEGLEDIIQDGFDEAEVRRVQQLVVRSEFKRKQAAPGLKVTDRAFGMGWKMPVAAKRTIDVKQNEGRMKA